jgi:hypothetical protein
MLKASGARCLSITTHPFIFYVCLRLVKTFAELRSMADEGQIQYPYSTREVVNIVKHLQVR